MRHYDMTKQLQDLRGVSWARRANTSGTSGVFLKARVGGPGKEVYYKLSCYDSYRGIYGHECVNELVAARLMDLLGVEHAPVKLVHGLVDVDSVEHETWLIASHSFRKPGEKKQALDLFYDLNKEASETPMEFCERYKWLPRIKQMMLVDYLIANRDRHGANIEVLYGKDGFRLAPLFDNGCSFVFSCYGDEERMRAFDPLEDVLANNYLGTRSLEENLRFVNGVQVNPLKEEHRERLIGGLDGIVSQVHQEVIWNIIWSRWRHIEEVVR